MLGGVGGVEQGYTGGSGRGRAGLCWGEWEG